MIFGLAPVRKTLSHPLNKSPPGPLPCSPVLILSLPDWATETLDDVFRNDLVFSSASQVNSWNLPEEALLNILNFCDAKSLLAMTKAFGGSEIVSEHELYTKQGDFIAAHLAPFRPKLYQAIIVDDSSILQEPAVASFVSEKYQQQGISVVIMAIEGIFDISRYRGLFGVDWSCVAYTKRTIHLTELGKQILSTDAFAPPSAYCKANFYVGTGALFAEFVDPADYEHSDDGDEDSEDQYDPMPDPAPGSPVVCAIDGNKSISCFGFVNSLDVSYGAIILRLCYAARHSETNGHV